MLFSSANKLSTLSLPTLACLAFAVTVAGCKPGMDAVNDLNSDLDGEAGLWAEVATKGPQQGDAGTDALSNWTSRIQSISEGMASVTEELGDASDKNRGKMRAELDSKAKSKLEVIIQRTAQVRILAPSWRKAQADALVGQVAQHLNAIVDRFGGVFPGSQTPSRGTISFTVDEDTTLADNRAQCMELVFAFAQGKGEPSWCLAGAARYCGHQMDLACVSYQISAAVQRGMGCSQGDGQGGTSESKWLGDVATCRSPSLVLKAPTDPIHTNRQACLVALDAYAWSQADSWRCLQVADQICGPATNLNCVQASIRNAGGEGCRKGNGNGTGYVAATWLSYLPACNP